MLFLASTFSSAALQLPARSSVASHSRAAVSMIAPVEVQTKKAVEGPTLSSMVKRSLGSAPARLLCLLRARQTGSKAAWHSQEEAGASSPRQKPLAESRRFLVRLPMQVQQVTRDAGSDPGGGAEARARADEERCALPLHARRRIGDRAGTSGCFHKKATRRTAAYLWPARPRWGQGAAARSGREGPDSHAHAHPHATQAEWDMTEKTGFKYAVGFNSCGACLHLPTGAHAQPEPEHSTPSRPFSSHSRPSLTLPLNPNPHPKPRP